MTGGGFAVKPLTVGAEITGLAPGDENDPAVRAALYDAWLEHGFLLFRKVDSVEHHLSLSRAFGELEIHPYPEMRSEVHLLLIELGGSKRPPAYVYDGKDVRINRNPWHRDTVFTPDTCKGAMLRMVVPAAEEGETLFADTARAYDALPEALKRRLEGLEYKASLQISPAAQSGPGAVWKTVRPATPEEDPISEPFLSHSEETRARFPSVVQPAVLLHPESGRRCIFVSPTYVDQFLGMDQQESDDLLHEITDHMLQPHYVYRHHWDVNDAIIWDNRRVLHAATGHKLDDYRQGLRTTLAGPLRTGRYFEDGAEQKTPDFAD
jgi:taurine dioxygenase